MLWLQFFLILRLSAAFLPARSNNAIISRPPTTGASSSSLKATSDEFTGFGNTGFVVLAGGTGSRMKASMPKQFLELRSCPVLHYSLHLFLEKIPAYCAANELSPPAQVVLVMDPKYQPEYQSIVDAYGGKLALANPGAERQGSVENGLNKLVELAGGDCEFVAVHDSARPLVTIPEILDVVRDAQSVGAAVLGVPCKATIKESDDGVTVQRTIPRARLWEVHTPQVVKVEALLRGFDKVEREGLEVTDDVSIIEALGEPVKLTLGEYTNLKITTPEDMDVATAILADRGEEDIVLGSVEGAIGIDISGRGTGRGGGDIIADEASEVDLSSSSGMTGAAAYGAKSPFSQTPAQRMDEKSHNKMGGARIEDGYPTGRVYPAKPTPSKWQE